MIYTIQNLVLPTDEKHQACRKLFYRGDYGIIDTQRKRLTLGFAQRCDFTTYLNACSWQKWREYTNLKNISLTLSITGDARVTLVGYHKDAFAITKKQFATVDIHHDTCKDITIPFPKNNEQMIGFEITALSDKVTIYRGTYTTEINETQLRPVSLHLDRKSVV